MVSSLDICLSHPLLSFAVQEINIVAPQDSAWLLPHPGYDADWTFDEIDLSLGMPCHSAILQIQA